LEKIPILIRFLLQSIEHGDKAKFIISKIRNKLNFNVISSLLVVENSVENDEAQVNINKSFGKLLFGNKSIKLTILKKNNINNMKIIIINYFLFKYKFIVFQ